MSIHIHCILPAYSSYNFLKPLLEWAESYQISIGFSVSNSRCSLCTLPSIVLRFMLYVELTYYTSLHSVINWKGFSMKDLLTSIGLEEEIRISQAGVKIVDLNRLLDSQRIAFHLYTFDYFKKEVLPVYGCLSQDESSTSYIAKRNSLIESYIAYIGKLVLDSVREMVVQSEPKAGVNKKFGISKIYQWICFNFKKRQRYFLNRWSLAWRWKGGKWNVIEKETNCIEADPFLVEQNGVIYCFYEKMKRGAKGSIYMRLFSGSYWSKETEVLREDFHLSYPVVWKENQMWYMMPESAENGDLRLYKCIQFPFVWEYQNSLLSGMKLFDTTPLVTESGSWLLTNRSFPGLSSFNDELFLIPFSNLQKINKMDFPLLPLIADVRKARCGGRLLHKKLSWIRFGQENAPYYGRNLRAFCIELSVPEYYKETETDWDLNINDFKGTHTYSSVGEMEMIDVLL